MDTDQLPKNNRRNRRLKLPEVQRYCMPGDNVMEIELITPVAIERDYVSLSEKVEEQ